ARQRMPFRRFPGRLHAFDHPIAEDGPIGLTAIVVLAGRDIASASREVDLKYSRVVLLALLPGQAAEVGAHSAFAVIAHWMSGVIVQRRQGAIAVPEAQRLQPGIDQPFGLLPGLLVLGGAGARVLHLAVRPQNAAIGGDLIHMSLADAK